MVEGTGSGISRLGLESQFGHVLAAASYLTFLGLSFLICKRERTNQTYLTGLIYEMRGAKASNAFSIV